MTTWRKCSNCKSPVAYGATYYVCSVSSCNTKRNPQTFCKSSCWDAHDEIMNHRDAWAIEKRAPAAPPPDAPAAPPVQPAQPRATVVSTPAAASGPVAATADLAEAPRETLIVLARMKEYIQDRAGFRTSDKTGGPLSDAVRDWTDRAIQTAIAKGQKTVLERDMPTPPILDDESNDAVMIVVSRLKAYVKARSGLRTSTDVVGPLSDLVRHHLRRAIREAAMDDRETVLDRDVDARWTPPH